VVCPYLGSIGTANDVAMNSGRVCATATAGVMCWPSVYAQDGTLLVDGDGGLVDAGSWGPSPVLDPDGKPLRSKQLTMGAGHTCALQTTGEVFCFGDNSLGQLGDGTTVSSFNKAVRVKGLADAMWVSSGTSFSCAVRANGSVVCWGDNTHGQLANNSTAPSMVPTPATALTQPVSMLSGCSQGVCDFMCAVTAGAQVWCWGANTYLQLGQGTTGPTESHVPLRVQGF
jgi:alpha-tubulin suppressor-like RCC1 family protein